MSCRANARLSETGSSSSSSGSSRISIVYVNTVLERLRNKQTRDSTARNYLSIWRHLNKFLINLDYKENLTWEEKTALFGAYLVDRGVQSSTLKSYFSAIKHILKQDGYEWNDKKALLSSLVKGCRIENDRLKVRLPIQKGLFEMLLFEVDRLYSVQKPQPYLKAMYKALFCLAYYGMMRVGELTEGEHTLKVGNISIGNKDKILVVLYSSKTHGKESSPQRIKIASVPLLNNKKDLKFFCPFRTVIKFIEIRRETYELDEEQLFVFKDMSPVKHYHVRSLLRVLLDRIGLDGSLYDVHSFRIGRTSDLEKFGYSIDQIKSMGRWRSNAVYRYLKN